ncbi:T9SS type A sorting domain-containing protein, partial [Bacteroidota bacterium]
EAIEEKLSTVKPTEYVLGNNYPNPFNSNTIIPVSIPEETKIELKIYNLLGEKVRDLYSSDVGAMRYYIEWDGRDNYGKVLASGIYICNLRTMTNKSLSIKMIIMK